MKRMSVASLCLVAAVVCLGVSGCDDGDSNQQTDVVTADSRTQDLDEPDVQEDIFHGDVSTCEDVECFAHAECLESTGECVCHDGFENWTDDAGCTPAPLAIAGHYDDEWGGHHEITSEVWTQSGFGEVSQFLVRTYSNAEGWLVARNGPDNAWNADLFSRFDWMWVDDGTGEVLWFCQTIFDAESEEAALNTPAADATDPAVAGCGDFPWTRLTPTAE